MIRSTKGKFVDEVAAGRCPKGFPADLFGAANRKLQAINNATNINDLRSPPGNRLEELSKDRKGQHSIRINDQWRVCFRWVDGDAEDVEIVDYHKG